VNGEPKRSESVDIAPRTSMDFILRVSVRGPLGSPMSTEVQFLTNDPLSPSCEIKVHVPCVVGDMAAKPSRIFVPNLGVGKTVVQTAQIYDYSRTPRTLTECISSSPEKIGVRILPNRQGPP